MTDERGRERSHIQFGIRPLLVGTFLFALFLGVIGVPIYRSMWSTRQYQELSGEIDSMLESLIARGLPGIPPARWKRAVWSTCNIIGQVHLDTERLRSLREQLRHKMSQEPSLDVLRWVWEECEHSGSPGSRYAVEFRDIALLTKPPITDDRLPNLWSLRKCTFLDLTDTQVTDAGLAHLTGLTNLRSLVLSGTQIADPGLVHLKRISGLKKLYLYGTNVSDQGLEYLHDLNQLEFLCLDYTAVTNEGVRRLKKALPGLVVSCRACAGVPVQRK